MSYQEFLAAKTQCGADAAIPLAEVLRRVEAAAPLRRRIGRHVLMDLCLRCTMSMCDPRSSACLGREHGNEIARRSYERNKAKRLAWQREYRARIPKKKYVSDPEALAIESAKRRARYAAKRAAEGRTVRVYRRKVP